MDSTRCLREGDSIFIGGQLFHVQGVDFGLAGGRYVRTRKRFERKMQHVENIKRRLLKDGWTSSSHGYSHPDLDNVLASPFVAAAANRALKHDSLRQQRLADEAFLPSRGWTKAGTDWQKPNWGPSRKWTIPSLVNEGNKTCFATTSRALRIERKLQKEEESNE